MGFRGVEKRPVTYRLPVDLIEKLEAEATRFGDTTTRVLTKMLEHYLAETCGGCGQLLPPGSNYRNEEPKAAPVRSGVYGELGDDDEPPKKKSAEPVWQGTKSVVRRRVS